MKSVYETLVVISIATGEDEQRVIAEPWGCPVKGSSQELPWNRVLGAVRDSVIGRVHYRGAVGAHWAHNSVQLGYMVVVIGIAETELGEEHLLGARGGH